MTPIKKWRDIIGTLEILAGSFLILPPIIIFIILFIMSSASVPSGMLSKSIMEFPSMFGLAIHTHSSYGSSSGVDTFGGFFLLNGFFWIGIIILINGIWKIRSNRYMKNED